MGDQVTGQTPEQEEVAAEAAMAAGFAGERGEEAPPAAVEKVQQAYLKVMADKAFTARLTAQAIQMLPPEQYTASALGKHTASEVARWKQLAAKANISLD